MKTFLFAYVASAVVFFGLDFVWLSTMVENVYRAKLGSLLLDKPILPVAGVFYLGYVVGIVVLAVMPAVKDGDWTRAAWSGALLGLVAYGTYDMTNLSTVRGWSASVSFIDLAWGTVVTAIAAVAGTFAARLA